MNNHENKPVIHCDNIAKSYHDGKIDVKVLHEVNLSIKAGEQVAIVGVSGAGKSTLLHLLGGLDKPTSGTVYIDDVDINSLSEKQRSYLRNQKLGFIYQLHHLLPEFTVLENVCMPLLLAKNTDKNYRARATELLEKIGLGHRLQHKIGELSGGERQRTAIARALVTNPVCVFADEPTGNLDPKTAEKVYDSMLSLNKELGTSLVIVTHDQQLASRMDRILRLEDGHLR